MRNFFLALIIGLITVILSPLDEPDIPRPTYIENTK